MTWSFYIYQCGIIRLLGASNSVGLSVCILSCPLGWTDVILSFFLSLESIGSQQGFIFGGDYLPVQPPMACGGE